MLGWEIALYSQKGGGAAPAKMETKTERCLGSWRTGPMSGTRWLDELVEKGEVTLLGGNGYPYRYTATAAQLAAGIEDSVMLEKLAGVPPEEWLLVEVEDMS